LTRWRYAAATDTGVVRETNQDAIFADDILALVADGMGGHAAGEVAAAITIELVRDEFHKRPTVEGLYMAIEAANRAILADARDNSERFGMGTTVIAVGLTRGNDGVVSPTLFNVGDSRAYQVRDGALRLLSEDHSVAEEWVRMGRLTPEEAKVHPRRHQLTRALGIEEELEIDVVSLNALPGDRILLCSDGLSNELSNETLAQLASSPTPLKDSVDHLVAEANQCGGHDNISVILLEFDEVSVATTEIKRTVSTRPPPVVQGSLATSSHPSKRSRRFTWRVWAGTALFALVLVGGVLVVHWYAYSMYYIGNDAGTMAIYQGQPNGVLWFKPHKVFDTTFPAAQLLPSDQKALDSTISEPTLADALKYATHIRNMWRVHQSVLHAATTTTTTINGVTTTTVKKTTG
jgi:serine/threonine protein phosphatase PrpC